MKVSAEYLSQNESFAALSPNIQETIAQKATWAEYPAKDDLFRQGDSPSALYILQSGRVKLYRQSKGRCQILSLPAAGDCLGAESLPTGAPNPYSATTLTPVNA
ncbi:MAG: cyclic nucleotide-binding domain-containing protein, partial [Anaerolineae bacterium]|nr:cyclic nucleotide-binding domain-containing protein [Anaerolineae bacterium]